MIFRYFRKRDLRHKIRWEDTLKQAYRLQQKGNLNLTTLLDKLDFNKKVLNVHLRFLRSKNFIAKNELRLTKQGEEQANRLVRAHRLWETYLVDQMGLTTEQIHEEAERYEHLLTDEILDEVDRELGFPAIDPHGSPILPKLAYPIFH